MKHNQKVTASSQVDSLLPIYIYENYSTFVDFMQTSTEAEERIGFGQDLLQNLQKYRDFDTYASGIVKTGVVAVTVSVEEVDEIQLTNGFGFPEENGVILIDNEVILYRTREENTLYGLQRGASATTVLPSINTPGTYLESSPEQHVRGSVVQNISVLFLVSMLGTIHNSFTPNISSERVNEEVNRSSLLQNIADFFASKGSKLGVQALFKMLFGETAVAVSYPGDRMVRLSDSTYSKNQILRTIPMPRLLVDPSREYVTPDKILGTTVEVVDYRTDTVVGRAFSDYISTYPYQDVVQYEYYIEPDTIDGVLRSNPATTLTRAVEVFGGADDRDDVTTITVESTVGFPDSGIIFIEEEGILYTHKTFNQFLGCSRGAVSVTRTHSIGTKVYGPYYVRTRNTTEEGVDQISASYPIGLVRKVEVVDGGLIQLNTDEIVAGGPGRTAPQNNTVNNWIENYNDDLAEQSVVGTSLGYVGNFTTGVSGVYFDEKFAYIASSNLPPYTIEPFSTDDSVGPLLHGENALHVIPQRSNIKTNVAGTKKGSDIIGVAVDGVPFYSNISSDVQVYGKILRFEIDNPGSGYVQPSVYVTGGAAGYANVIAGQVVSIDVIFSPEYTVQPEVFVSDGLGARVSLEFDTYGRITAANVVDGGSGYNTPPTVQIRDGSGRGRGASIVTKISAGEVVSVDVLNSGIDYTAATTSVSVIPVGSGCVARAICESWTFDSYYRIRSNPNTDLDRSNAFLFDDADGNASKFAYIGNPTILRNTLGDNGGQHSPILGFAVDGNPIYGPYGFVNSIDDTEGVEPMVSGYVLPDDRTNSIPDNSQNPAEHPPSTEAFPMGTFIEDYVWDPVEASVVSGRIWTDPDRDQLQAENEDYINYQFPATTILDRFNGRVCNTPEFPADLYPDGVFCYFMPIFGDLAKYPYVVGDFFRNRPQSQNVILMNDGEVIEIDTPASSYDNSEVTIDFTSADRLRNPYLTATSDNLDVAISGYNEILKGTIASVNVEDGLVTGHPAVGDFLYFDNTGTEGTGARAKVTHVTTNTSVVVDTGATAAPAGGEEIVTRLFSHTQRIVLSGIVGEQPSYAFPVGFIVSSSGGAEGIVQSYDNTTKTLIVRCTTKKLFKYGDTFFDGKLRAITLPENATANATVFDTDVVGGTSTHMAYTDPTSDTAEPGDLWWNSDSGRLFIYYNDGDTSQWVSAMPIGSRSFGDYSTSLTTGPTSGSVSTVVQQAHSGNTVAISETAPSRRTDGSPNQAGDLWWSSHTGMLYVYNSDDISGYPDGTLPWSQEWVCTDPTGTISMEGASNDYEFETTSAGGGPDYEDNVRVVISDSSPATLPGGGAVTPGTLWWSPINGKMYIYFTDLDSSSWVIVNPSGTLSGRYANDTLVVGDGNGETTTLSILPEPADNQYLWVEQLNDIFVGDNLKITDGAPGETEFLISETVKVEEILSTNQIRVRRGTTPAELPHGAKVTNMSRYIYRVTTDIQNGLKPGIEIIIKSPLNPGLEGNHFIQSVGDVSVAVAEATISGGSVTAVTVTDSGRNYPGDFYVYFNGGGGVGAYGYATVDNGQVTGVSILEGGVKYTTIPDVVMSKVNSDRDFTLYVDQLYPVDPDLTFETTDKVIHEITQTRITRVELISGGIGYSSLPLVIGTQHREVDRPATKIDLDGTGIGGVEIVGGNGGSRYNSPVAKFGDLTGSGSGATANVTVTNGVIAEIEITNPGSGYVEPVVEFVELGGVYSMTTTDIGRITDVEVIDPGRNISSERALAPELILTTRLVFTRVDNYDHGFNPGDAIYQGSPTKKTATATVTSVDSARQILVLENVDGKFVNDEMIYGPGTVGGKLIMVGQANLKIDVAGSSTPRGKFITDKSKISEEFAVIQDSEYYQWFSYEISSAIQQVQYETLVKDIIHPAGFAMFSKLNISKQLTSKLEQTDPIITLS